METDIIIIHDPLRMALIVRDQDSNGDWYTGKYTAIAVGIDGLSDDAYNPNMKKWDEEEFDTANMLYKLIEYDNSNFYNDKRNVLKLQFPVIRIPEKYIYVDENGARHEGKPTNISFNATTRVGEIIYPSGSTMPMTEMDPTTNANYCAPVGENTTDICGTVNYSNRVIGNEPAPNCPWPFEK